MLCNYLIIYYLCEISPHMYEVSYKLIIKCNKKNLKDLQGYQKRSLLPSYNTE